MQLQTNDVSRPAHTSLPQWLLIQQLTWHRQAVELVQERERRATDMTGNARVTGFVLAGQ